MKKSHGNSLVLVIEDDTDIRHLIVRVLALEGFATLEADNGEQGLKLARENRCALVILDLRLPGRGGWAVLEEMKQVPSLCHIPVIVFTASVATPQRERALRMGAADYLVKPLSTAALRESIIRVLSQ